MKFSAFNLFSDFQSGGMDKEEFEEMIREAVEKENPENSIKHIKYLKKGIEVILDNGEIIEIEIDWNEIIVN